MERCGSPAERARRLAPYGRLVSAELGTSEPANRGRARRHPLGHLAHDQPLRLASALFHDRPLQLASALFEVPPSDRPFRVEFLEMHPRTEQLILPLHATDGWIVLVAPERAGAPDLDRPLALRLGPHEGIVYGRGVWHLPLLTEGPSTGLFLVQSMQDGTTDDCIEHPLGRNALLLQADA